MASMYSPPPHSEEIIATPCYEYKALWFTPGYIPRLRPLAGLSCAYPVCAAALQVQVHETL